MHMTFVSEDSRNIQNLVQTYLMTSPIDYRASVKLETNSTFSSGHSHINLWLRASSVSFILLDKSHPLVQLSSS